MARINIRTAQTNTGAGTWHELENVSGPFGVAPTDAAVELCIGHTTPSSALATTVDVGSMFKRQVVPTGPIYVSTTSVSKVSWYSYLLNSVAIIVSADAILGFEPKLVLNFKTDTYKTGGSATTFSFAITHAATTNATMVGSDGLLKWRPHNLMTSSGDLSGTGWSGSMTRGAVTSGSPFGTYHTISPTGSGGMGGAQRYQTGKTLTSGATYVSSALVKYSAGSGWFDINMYDTGDATKRAYFDVQNGVVGVKDAANIDHGMVDYGDGWWLCWASANAASTSGGPLYEVPNGDGAQSCTATDVILIAGTQFNRSDLGGMVNNPDTANSYVPTTTAPVYLSRRGHHIYNGSAWVNEGILHESEARTNLLTYSNDFTNGAWSKTNLPVTANQATGPDGTVSATEVGIASIPATSYAINPAASTTGTLSYFVKQNTERFFLIIRGGYAAGDWAIFDLSTGTVSKSPTFTNSSAHMVPMGNGWYRCVLQSAQMTGVNAFSISGSGTNTTTSTSGTVYLWGAQVEAGATPSSYIPTAGATVTRAAETLTVPAANLPWPATVETTGTELATNGTFDSDSGWTLHNSVISNGVVSANNGTRFLAQDSGLVTGTSYKVTFDYTQGTTHNSGKIRVNTNAGNGAGTEHVSSNFYYMDSSGSLTFIIVAEGPYVAIEAAHAPFSGTIDNVSVKEINPLALSIQMDGKMTYADAGSENNVRQYVWQSSGTNYIQARVRTHGTRTGQPLFVQRQPTSGYDDVTGGDSTYSPDTNVTFNIASRHGSTFINGAHEGTLLTANTTPTVLPALSATDLNLGNFFMGTIGQFRMWSDDLGDVGITEATLPSTEPSLSLTFDGSENSFIVLDWSE